jgi:hypothetical protein
MCYICGNPEITNPKHQERVIHSLDDAELDHLILKIKGQIQTLGSSILYNDEEEKKQVSPRVVSELRRTLLGLIGEKLSRFRHHRPWHRCQSGYDKGMTKTKVISAQSEYQLNNLFEQYEKEGYEFLPPLVVRGKMIYATVIKKQVKPANSRWH